MQPENVHHPFQLFRKRQQRKAKRHLFPLFDQGEYFFCCYSLYPPILLAIYNYLAPHVIDVCIGPNMTKEEEDRTGIASHTCKNLPPSNLNIYTLAAWQAR
jgi:hypothetical protein